MTRSAQRVPEQRGGLDVTRQQAAVVDHVLHHLVTVVNAGAGSGKTWTTVATVLEIVQQRLASLDQFVLITFTVKASEELRERLERAVRTRVQTATGADRAYWLDQQERLAAAHVGTIHDFCRRLLKLHGYADRIARELAPTRARLPLDEAIRDAVDELHEGPPSVLLDGNIPWREYQLRERVEQLLEMMRNRGHNPAQVATDTEAQADDIGKPYRLAFARLVARANQLYTECKREDQVLDASDQLAATAGILASPDGAAVLDRLIERHRYVFVDEFQDTDRTQKAILDQIASAMRRFLAKRTIDHAGLMVVGDRKQSIYGFRAADASMLEELAKQHGVTMLPLSLARRPTEPLLEAQNALFKSIGDASFPFLRDPLQPWDVPMLPGDIAPMQYHAAQPSPPSAGPASSAAAVTMAARIQCTADVIRDALGQGIFDPPAADGAQPPKRQVRPGDIAILVRNNSQVEEYVDGLSMALAGTTDASGAPIEVRAETGGRFYQHPAVVAAYRLLLLILNPRDDKALSLALDTPYLQAAWSSSRAAEAWSIQFAPSEGAPITAWFERHHPDLRDALAELRKAARTEPAPQLLARLYSRFDIFAYYRARGNARAVENLEKLRERARGLFRVEQALTLRTFVDWLRIAITSGRAEDEAEIDSSAEEEVRHIRVMTVHRAKGLEFPIVIIPEVQEPLVRGATSPRFLIYPNGGLDARLTEWTAPLQTQSPRYRIDVKEHAADQLEEEIRIFYVAVTRAQQAVIFVGSDPPRVPRNKRYPDYSWQDEIIRA